MSNWSLPILMSSLHKRIENDLSIARASLAHPTTKGDASEHVWVKLLSDYLPKRYVVSSGHVVDSTGQFSDQIDVIIYDRQYTPLIFEFGTHVVVPAESVYAVFEAKQKLGTGEVTYAQDKVATVRKLHRSSTKISSANGTLKPKELHHILGGLITLDITKSWQPLSTSSLEDYLLKKTAPEGGLLDIGCAALHGYFYREGVKHKQINAKAPDDPKFIIEEHDKSVTAFLFRLISMLQEIGTVPMIDVMAYAQHLSTSTPHQD